MNFQNNRYTLRYADASDNEGIKEIFESGSFQGDFNIPLNQEGRLDE